MEQGPLRKALATQIGALESCVEQLGVNEAETPNCSPAGTDLKIEWADACSLGQKGERYFLLVVDKDTEYLANLNTQSRQNPVDLLQAYVNTTEKRSKAHDRMQPAFAGTRDTVAIPFGSCVVSTLPREHRRVVNGSFGDRFVEGIYLHADSQTPTKRMFDLASRTELSVKDFKSYPDEFPF